MKNKLYRKLKGFQKHYKSRHLIAKELQLTDEEYRLWDFMVAVCDWDSNHTDTYLSVEATLEHIAELIGWSRSKVSRVMKGLLRRGVIVHKKDIGYIVTLRAERGAEEEDKEQLTRMGIPSANIETYFLPMRKDISFTQQKRGYEHSSSLVSSKGDLVSKTGSLLEEDKEWIEQYIK